MILILLTLSVLFLAYSNGANDNLKGVATLFGSNTTNYKGAITLATVATFAGSIAALFLADTLIKNFSGKGLVTDELLQSSDFAISIALGAALTVFIATHIGMPISITHALVGALFGSGFIALGNTFNFSKLSDAFIIPLIVSPLLAALTSLIGYIFFNKFRVYSGVKKNVCVCIENKYKPVIQISNNQLIVSLDNTNQEKLLVANKEECVERYHGSMMGFDTQTLLDFAHFTSGGIVSFARGLNDTPKMAGLMLIISTLNISWGILGVAIAIALGGLINAKEVGETIAKKITPLTHGQGFTANLVTGLLIITASYHGMPVSTTHVSVGSIIGIGMVTKKGNLKAIKNILLSWLLTLPTGALISGTIYWFLQIN